MDESEQRSIAERVAARFRRRGHRGYIGPKVRFDPAYAAVADLLAGSGTDLLDVGCGLGLLGFYLRERGFRGGYLGIDFDEEKIAAAREAARGEAGLSFVAGDAGGLPPFSGHVALLDILHYLPAGAQQRLLADAAARVAPGALLAIRNVLRERSWRFHATVLEERFMHAVGWMRSRARHYPARGEIEAPLRAAGLAVEAKPLWGRTPFNSFAIVGRRR